MCAESNMTSGIAHVTTLVRIVSMMETTVPPLAWHKRKAYQGASASKKCCAIKGPPEHEASVE